MTLDEDMEHEHEVEKAMEYGAMGISRSSEEVAEYLPVRRGPEEEATQEAEAIEIEDDVEAEVIEIDDDGEDGEETKMVGLDSDSSDGWM